ncbi:unnamed protein product [Ranitomeya imitator]|uniref:Uncharacterized protein n=1 Tax=Ranitomeya imitator TaxID=111125 RepID=A0ABN9M3H8_9NEOB|nr:unnamed protein product [Ranitomeya imitator]
MPFRHTSSIFGVDKRKFTISFQKTIQTDFPAWFNKVMSYVSSPVVVLPALLLLFIDSMVLYMRNGRKYSKIEGLQ